MSTMLENMTNPNQKEQIEERMAQIKSDPSLKPILDEIESGGPQAMMKYFILSIAYYDECIFIA
jgi:hypothetical protein